MKYLPLLATLFLFSCGPKGEDGAKSKNDSLRIADSISKAMKADSVVKADDILLKGLKESFPFENPDKIAGCDNIMTEQVKVPTKLTIKNWDDIIEHLTKSKNSIDCIYGNCIDVLDSTKKVKMKVSYRNLRMNYNTFLQTTIVKLNTKTLKNPADLENNNNRAKKAYSEFITTVQKLWGDFNASVKSADARAYGEKSNKSNNKGMQLISKEISALDMKVTYMNKILGDVDPVGLLDFLYSLGKDLADIPKRQRERIVKLIEPCLLDEAPKSDKEEDK